MMTYVAGHSTADLTSLERKPITVTETGHKSWHRHDHHARPSTQPHGHRSRPLNRPGFCGARDSLGHRLRDLRQDAAGLTGRQLALLAGWRSSKVSKIEYGKQTPTDGDLRV
ncbi:helix-turn-helix domain-containing protein [Micromonospora sp. S-DT3-3-22]|uniref:helix-turn-helix domain-containing protein n=1 Tax=Micromonospora sp. S-DT3-3-22 TaxID=2755359 RepID=UPI0035CBC344